MKRYQTNLNNLFLSHIVQIHVIVFFFNMISVTMLSVSPQEMREVHPLLFFACSTFQRVYVNTYIS